MTPGDAAVAWSRERWVRVGEYDVRYREAGEGPPVVLVHGLGLSADFWWKNGPPLAVEGFRVLAPDLPGFGKTEGPAYLPVEAQAAWTARFADALALGPAAYVGHSVSAQAMLQLAADEPERVAALVLAAPTGDPAPLRRTRQALGFVTDAVFEPVGLVPAVGEPYFRAGIPRWLRTWASAGGHDTLGAARRAKAPGIVILGKHDPVVRRGFARELAEALPGGRCIELERGAHAVVFDAPEDFNREVVAFLREVLASR
ncbi:alpha/beta hydrolase [Longimicrobium sp.]|uniref:alpha/beta fold hydrolase n=1 Tax=Longimicrobium sp. TaxID=2029185 RepID=UPI002C7DCB3F|nr:alpha/beta hydrolase [Longimicrobium sp.]HSU16399.1 alpha/beta hydrolase [Longimicrobium sp.]